ncbi:hypothetical protein [uncultured Halomonas sp.]|uniref:hypothetical protein n=1 Tax=uncultured Halomonas sp. TaxID=173971 RepID=UPI0026079C4C|nr:hypothetical protein [uncultured Halomonas sp.]
MSLEKNTAENIDRLAKAANDLPADFARACRVPDHPYHRLAKALLGAYAQAAQGKGKVRHANDLPFERQRMLTIAQGQGSAEGLIYQVCKKAQESQRMARGDKIHELGGVIVYAAGAIVFEENRHE